MVSPACGGEGHTLQDIYSLRLHIWSIYKFIDTCTVCVRETYPNLELVEQVAGHMRQVSVAFGNHDDELRVRVLPLVLDWCT